MRINIKSPSLLHFLVLLRFVNREESFKNLEVVHRMAGKSIGVKKYF